MPTAETTTKTRRRGRRRVGDGCFRFDSALAREVEDKRRRGKSNYPSTYLCLTVHLTLGEVSYSYELEYVADGWQRIRLVVQSVGG